MYTLFNWRKANGYHTGTASIEDIEKYDGEEEFDGQTCIYAERLSLQNVFKSAHAKFAHDERAEAVLQFIEEEMDL